MRNPSADRRQHMDELLLPAEHEHGGQYLPNHGLLADMRRCMPFVAEQLSRALDSKRAPGRPLDAPEVMQRGLEDIYPVEQRIQDHLVPALLAQRNTEERTRHSSECEVWFGDPDPRNVQLAFAMALDLGLLSHVFAGAKIALAELVQSQVEPFKSAALLSLLYCDCRHPRLNDLSLNDLLQSRLLFDLPLSMLQKVLPALGDVFLADRSHLNLLIEWFSNPMKAHLFSTPYHRAEVAIFLASLGQFVPMILTVCLLEWSEQLEPKNALYQACRVRCLRAVARLLATHPEALAYYTTEMASIGDAPDLEDWTNALFYLEPDLLTSAQLEELLTFAEAMLVARKMPLFYEKVVRAYVSLARHSPSYGHICAWILQRLKDDDKEKAGWTLDSIGELAPIDPGIARQVLALKKDTDNTVMRRATELALRWQLEETAQLSL